MELKDKTIETLLEMDEPEALLRTLRDTVARKVGQRWQALGRVLGEAEMQLDLILNAKPAGPDFTKPAPPDEALVTDETTRLWMAKQKPKPEADTQPDMA